MSGQLDNRVPSFCPRSETDITTAFEAVIAGSNPAEGEANKISDKISERP